MITKICMDTKEKARDRFTYDPVIILKNIKHILENNSIRYQCGNGSIIINFCPIQPPSVNICKLIRENINTPLIVLDIFMNIKNIDNGVMISLNKI